MPFIFRSDVKWSLLFSGAVVAVAVASGETLSSGASMQEMLTKCRTNEEREKLIRKWHQMPPREFFYGKVVDAESNPIPNATVDVSWYTISALGVYSPAPLEDSLTTDKEGRFRKRCERAMNFFVNVSKEGYEEVEEGGSRDFMNHPWHSENAPVTITMRKKGPSTFLIVAPGSNRLPEEVLRVEGMGRVSRLFDLLAWDGRTRKGWRNSATANADLRIDAAFDADKKCWNVAYSVTNGPGGIVLSDKMLYEAPTDGYAPSVSLTVTNVYDWRRYLYMKSRVPAIYSRVLFEHGATVGTNPSLRVSCKVWVNPYGERGLEEDERVTETQWRTRKELTAESIQAIRSGRLPPKPDIEQRIKETDERVAREETEKERRHKEWLEQLNSEKESKVK